MRALVAAELVRLASRRLIKVLVGLVALGAALAGVLAFVNTDATDPGGLSSEVVERRYQDCVDQATADPRGAPLPRGPIEAPEAEEFREAVCRDFASQVSDDRFPTGDLPEVLMGTTGPLMILALVLGASSIGGDWPTRSITTLLTFEPRRARVLVAKAAAVAAVAVGLVVVGQALIVAGLLPALLAHGTGSYGGDWGSEIAGVLARGSVLGAVLGIVGFAGASVARTTTVVLGCAFGYVVVVENVITGFFEGWRQWLLIGNAAILVTGDDGAVQLTGRSVEEAAVYLIAVSAAFLAGAVAVFTRRDVV